MREMLGFWNTAAVVYNIASAVRYAQQDAWNEADEINAETDAMLDVLDARIKRLSRLSSAHENEDAGDPQLDRRRLLAEAMFRRRRQRGE